MPRVLVCGGRDFQDDERLNAVLDKLHIEAGIDRIIHGDARGADRFAGKWASVRGVPCDAYPADWEHQGSFAGPARNLQMLREAQPDLVIAFPGGRGTADMVKKARKSGVEVIEIAP